MKAASVTDYRRLAKRKVPHFLFEYLDGGSYSEATKSRNVTDLEGIELRQRVLRDVGSIDTGIELFGRHLAMPLALAPVGLAGLYARRGEVQAARAAESAGVPFTLSTVSACTLEEVVDSVTEPIWFQLYMVRDRAFMRDLLSRATRSNCTVLLFTVDMPLPGSRYRDVRSGLAGASGLRGHLRRVRQALARPSWAWDVGLMGRPHHLGNVAPLLGERSGLEDFMMWMKNNFDPRATWRDLDFIREHWHGPIVVKGILDVDDAREAVEHGVDGIVVSNHGGRQLDGAPSTARVLPEIASAVGDRTVVLADGGVRSGLDVVRMLGLGASSVLIGRSWVYALAANGEAGVAHVLQLIHDELRVAMALTGHNSIHSIDERTLRSVGPSAG